MDIVDRIKAINEEECVVNVLLNEMKDHPCKNCGKCVYGYEGLTQAEMIFKDMSEKKAKPQDKALLEDVSTLMSTQSLCTDGKMLGLAIQEALHVHEEIIDEHISKKQCRAGVCKAFLTMHILASKCDGCNECMDVCEDDAILGKSKFVHVIDNDECTLCGKCLKVCKKHAIVFAGLKKPKCPKKPIPCRKR